MKSPRLIRGLQKGMVYTEYAIATFVMIVVLFTPTGALDGLSLVEYVLRGINQFGANSSLLLSLP